MAQNRMAAALKEWQKRADREKEFQRLSSAQADRIDQVPVVGRVSANVEPKYSLGDRIHDLSAGIGRGLGEQAVDTLNMIAHPVQTARTLYDAARSAITNPSATARQMADALRKDYGQITSGNMYDAGETLGKYLSLRPKPRNVATSELDVYHGTPHRFEPTEANPLGEFDASKIGTGEGAQVYGHGIYVAENPSVAQEYRSNLAGRPEIVRLNVGGKSVGGFNNFDYSPKGNSLEENIQSSLIEDLLVDEIGLLGKHAAGGDKALQDAVLQNLEQRIKDYATEWPEGVPAAHGLLKKLSRPGSVSLKLGDTPGGFYRVDLPDEMIDRMLDWDKPLSEQSAAVRELTQRLRSLPGDPYNLERYFNPKNPNKGPLGGEIYEAISEHFEKSDDAWKELGLTPYQTQNIHDAASQYAAKLGIPGIKYLDAGSRGQGGSGTRNFVVFPGEEKKVKILERK